MRRLVTLATTLAAALALAAAAPAAPAAPEDRAYQPALLRQPEFKWWQTGVVYQIYPASFMDSDGNGYGDLKGITSKLEYLSDLGVAALWLSPIFKSPDKDMGYDISDYKEININYGNLADFEEMVEKAHSLGLKVILDFVPNHSSDEHRWFEEALKGPDNPYHDFYVWHEGIEVDGVRKPPTNWGSIFDDMIEGSAWQWEPNLQKYYYRTFHQGQPDLNYTNPAVVTEMKNVFRFWARKGVDGFRIDAIPYLFEDRLLRDNTRDGERTENLPETYDMVRQWRQVFDEEGARLGKDLVMMLEAYADIEHTMKYYGSKDFPAGHFPFNFQFISNLDGESSAKDYDQEIHNWEDNKPSFGWSNWVVGNHDNNRVGSRLGENNVDGVNMLVLLLPGTAVTYYGEELGMLDHTGLTLEHCRDPQACPDGASEAYYQSHTRDFERTPMQWDTSEHAGFTTGDPWLPVTETYLERNVAVEKDQEDSHLNIYKKLVELRKEAVLQTGTLETKVQENVVSFLRQNDTYSLLVLINLHESATTFNVIDHYGYIGDLEAIVSSNFDDANLDLKSVSLNGNAAVVLGGQRFKWWQTGIVYQIYPRSFKDNIKDDGVGDLPGITEKLDYLKELGVTTVWLSPIYASPNYDMGYDISDFENIHVDFGTLDDFRAMVTKAHDLGLKIVLDFVPNHSSSEHKWFQEALKKDEKYFNYYVWMDGITNEDSEARLDPPNNWRSEFDGSKDGTAWTYVDNIGQYYLHQFHEYQPDLNFSNPEVVQEIKDVLKFWLDEGVDGFRVDAIPHLFEDDQWRDNPENSNQYLVNQPKTYEMVQQWRELLDEQGKAKGKDLVLMLEVWAEGQTLQDYFGTADRPGGHFPFNFFFITDLIDKYYDNDEEVTAEAVNKAIDKWMEIVPDYGWSNWVLGNHDKHRVGSRFGEELIDAFNMLVTLLPGTAITYYGEEIGMLDNRDIPIENCRDDQACRSPDPEATDADHLKYFHDKSRDFERTPFHWDTTEHAGFCEDCEPWLPISNEFETINVRVEETIRKSHLFLYKRLAQLRKEPALQSGEFESIIINDNVLCISRKNDSYAYLVLINFDKEEQIVNVAEHHEDVGSVKETLSSGFTSTDMDLSAVRLAAHAAVVVEGALRKKSTEPEELKWWQEGIVYQIYPRSFQDSDGDGIGDLKGITSRLQYLRNLGVTAVWFSPIFSSPDADIGYDISDFKNINDIFGTLGDFDELLQEAHRLGLKVMLDFVPNHSSDEHAWFQDALKNGKNSLYYDYYVWREGQEDGSPPNNWEGSFTRGESGSAWSKYKNPETGEDTPLYYLHQFHKKQPDLNYRNPQLVQEMKDVLSFWVRRGVDGFRVDAIQHLAEDAAFRDNTLDRDMQIDQDLTYEMIKQWRDLLDREGSLLQKDLVLLLEVYADVEPLMKYFGEELRPAGDFPFNFYLISDLDEDNLSANELQETISKWLDNKPEFGWSNWVVGNHDNTRVGTRLGSDLIDAYNMLVTLLPGTAITYNGEELGMLDNDALRVADCQDPQACPEGHEDDEEYYRSNSRDYERTPMQWDDSDNAGFTTGRPWLPVHENYKTVNVQTQEAAADSHLNVYKKLAALRNQLAIQRGDFHMETIGTDVFSFSRRNVSHAYVVLINFANTEVTVQLNNIEAYVDLPKMLKYTSSSNFNVEDEAEVSRESLALPARSAVVLTSEPVVDHEDYSDPDYSDGLSTAPPVSLLLLAVLPLAWLLRA